MKIRIKGNSLRIRLSRSEVNILARQGCLEEQTCFGTNTFVYAVQVRDDTDQLSADFIENKITMYVQASLINNWPINAVVGFDAWWKVNDTERLHLKLEKDFVCIDESTEDQSDNYENPNKNC